jgi:hypothetical protein
MHGITISIEIDGYLISEQRIYWIAMITGRYINFQDPIKHPENFFNLLNPGLVVRADKQINHRACHCHIKPDRPGDAGNFFMFFVFPGECTVGCK